MNNKIIILIHTKNSALLNRLLINIRKHPQLKDLSVIIVDDTPQRAYIDNEKNDKLIKGIEGFQYYYINSKIWDSLKERYILSRLVNNESRSLLNNIKLGSIKWNTPNARNVGLILMRLFTPYATHFLNLDDDMYIPSNFRIGDMHLKNLMGIKIAGCPDFGRVSWMQYYLRFINKVHGYNFTTTGNPYVDSIVKYLSIDQDCHIIQEYSNFETPFSSSYAFDYIPKLPIRKEISGGAYISSVENASTNLFPSSFNEDFMWFSLIDKDRVKFIDQYVIHKSVPKSILNQKLIEMEEYGRIFYRLFEFRTGITEHNISKLKIYLQKREFEIQREIAVAQRTSRVIPTSMIKTQVEEIELNLKKLQNFINSQDVSIYVNAYKEFLSKNSLWQNMYEKINPIDTGKDFNHQFLSGETTT